MILTDLQRARLEQIAKSTDGPFLRELLEAYILEIKDECVLKDLSKEAARIAIEKLDELRKKFVALSGEAPPKPSNQFC